MIYKTIQILLFALVCSIPNARAAEDPSAPESEKEKTDEKTNQLPADSATSTPKAPTKSTEDKKQADDKHTGSTEKNQKATAATVTPPKISGKRPIVLCPTLPEESRKKVKVSLIVTETGTVASPAVVKGVEESCDKAALAAANTLLFEPAKLGDKAVAVKIRWSIAVKGPDKPPPPPIPTSNLSGTLQERGTRERLPGLVVQLSPLNVEVVTDETGGFAFEGVPDGEYKLIIPSYDHEEKEVPLKLPLKEPLVLRLKPLPKSKYKITIELPRSDVSRIVVSAKEASKIPGGSGDPVRVIEVIPGVGHVSAAGPGAGQIIVRGSAPEDTKNFIDGLPAPQLYHFGNIYSILQQVYIEDIDFRTGGFSAEYGNATGGILNLTLAPIPTDGPHLQTDVNVYHSAIAASTPVSDSWAVSAGVRRSYIDTFLPSVLEGAGLGSSFIAAPVYYDYQLRADHTPSRKSRLKLLAYGTSDSLGINFAEPSASDPATTGFGINQVAHQIQGSWTYLPRRDTALRVGLVSGYVGLRLNIGEDRSFKLRVCPLVLRTDIEQRLTPSLKIRGGLYGAVTSYGVDLELGRRQKEGQLETPQSAQEILKVSDADFEEQAESWAEIRWEPSNNFGLIGGARFSKWFGVFDDFTIEPRGTVFWQLADRTRLTIGAGLNTQRPSYDETSPDTGNPDLISESSIYGVMGIKQQFGEQFALDIQVFSKSLDNLVSPVPFDPDNTEAPPYDNKGEGTVIGGEILARYSKDRLNAWFSYTLSESLRTDRPGEDPRPFSYDQTHVISFVSSLALNNDWGLGMRSRYSTGNPYTPLTVGYYDSTNDVYVPRPAGEPLSDRIDDFFALDLRVDKTYRFENWLLKTYLEITNATNRFNVEQVGYRYDYSERQDITGLPLTPSFGIQGVY